METFSRNPIRENAHYKESASTIIEGVKFVAHSKLFAPSLRSSSCGRFKHLPKAEYHKREMNLTAANKDMVIVLIAGEVLLSSYVTPL